MTYTPMTTYGPQSPLPSETLRHEISRLQGKAAEIGVVIDGLEEQLTPLLMPPLSAVPSETRSSLLPCSPLECDMRDIWDALERYLGSLRSISARLRV